MPFKNTLGVKKGEAKSEVPVNVKTSESTGDSVKRLISDIGQGQAY